MTLTRQGKPSRKRSVYGHSTNTSTVDVYTCPANCSTEVSYIHVHNSTGNTNITIEWYVAADSYTHHFLEGKNLGVGEFVTFSDIELILSPGDKIRITPSATAHVDSIVTVTETLVPVG